MSQVLLFTSPNFRGTISDTPSGTAYHVKPGDTIAADERDVPFLLGYGFAPAAPPATESTGDVVGPASATSGHLAVFDGATGKLIKDGGAVPSSGSVVAPGLGLSTITNAGTITISNTGTISQPNSTGVTSSGILLQSGDITNPGTDSYAYAANFSGKAGNVIITNIAGYGRAGYSYLTGGQARNSAGDIATGATVEASGGISSGSGTLAGGNLILKGGNAAGTNRGGGIIIAGGSGTTNGHVILNNLGTVDPHILNAAWLGVSNGITLSAG